MKKQGFILLELVVYLIVSISFFLSILYASHSLINYCAAHRSTMNRKMQLYCVAQLLNRDLSQLPSSRERWITFTDSTILWHRAHKLYGWELQNKTLYRISGIFDEQTKKITKQHKNKALQELDSGFFEVGITDQNTKIEYVGYALQLMLNNGKLYKIHTRTRTIPERL